MPSRAHPRSSRGSPASSGGSIGSASGLTPEQLSLLSDMDSTQEDKESLDAYNNPGSRKSSPPGSDVGVPETKETNNGLAGDYSNMAILTFLYVLQGIPLGIAAAIPYLLQSRSVSYKDQAIYSFVYWPFSVKLLWAPIVDAAFIRRLGRRKSWLVPTQYLIGLFMYFLSHHVTQLMGDDNPKAKVNIILLTVIFFALNFLAATQDIAVDGWALTMLARRNVGWASTCNTVGQTCGYFLGYVVFLALESENFCNTYIRSIASTGGIVNLASFLWFWSIVFTVTTTLVLLLKSETDVIDADQDHQSVLQTYKLLWRIIQLPSVKTLIGILLTVKIGFAAADAVTGLKLIEAGLPRDRLALLGIPMIPIQIILPIIISKYTAGPRPMDIFLKAMPFRLLMGLEFALVVWWAPTQRLATGEYPLYFYGIVLVSYAIHQVTLYPMYVSSMSFHAQVSDPVIGGSYMTLLNTFANLGGNWPATVALWMVDSLTWKSCSKGVSTCASAEDIKACGAAGGTCSTYMDGYYLESAICIVIGFIWLRLRSRATRQLQDLRTSDWTCT